MNGFVHTTLWILMLFVPACGTLEVFVLGTPTPDGAAIGTIAALQAQKAVLATQIAALNSTSTPAATTATPAPQPTGTRWPNIVQVPAATRITFLDGATSSTVSGSIKAGQSKIYVVKALKGQPMLVYVASLHADVTVSIATPSGRDILSYTAHQSTWAGHPSLSGDYYLTVKGSVYNENFSLTVTIPSRIQFGAGATSATENGTTTVAGSGVNYVVYAGKGQTMNVSLGNLSGKVWLSIYGFTDGQLYLNSDKDQAGFEFVLPLTQDYKIGIVPATSSEVSYSMKVTIQ